MAIVKKMKKIAAYILGSFCLLVLVLTIAPRSLKQSNVLDLGPLYHAEGMENSAARKDWEHRRLADPATGEIPKGIRAKELAFAANLPKDGYQKIDSLTAPWTQRGPYNLGGRTRAFAMDVTNSNVLLAGGVSGGIWRSSDAGTTWTRMTMPGAHPGVNHIVQDTRIGHTNTWYALSGEAYGTSASGGGAFYLGSGLSKSTDGGLTWSILGSTNSNTPQTFDNVWDATWNVAIDPSDTVNDIIYAAMIGAIMRSTNGGNSWTRVRGSSTSNLSYFTNVMTTPSGKAYAGLSSFDAASGNGGTNQGIWRSSDGINWFDISPSFMANTYRRIVSAYNPLDENRVYFVVAMVDSSSGKRSTDFLGRPEWNALYRYTYISGDGTGAGGFWENLTENIPVSGGPFDKFIVQGSYNLCISVNPNDTNMVILGGTNLYRSTTAFNDSTHTTHIGGYEVGAGAPVLYNGLYPNQHPDMHVMFYDPNQPNALYNANDGGIWRTDDVTATTPNWTSLNNGYQVSQFYTLAIDHGTVGSDRIVGGLQDNGSYWIDTPNPTSPWKWVAGGDGSYCAIVDGGGTYYLSKQLGVIAKCEIDGSGNVTAFERIDPIGASGHEFINPFVLDPNNQNVMYLPAGRTIWRNSDLSQIALNGGWDSITTNWSALPDTIPVNGNITAISISEAHANRLYVGTDAKAIYRIDNANTSSPTMTSLANTLMPAGGFVSCLAVDPDDGDHVVAVYSNYGVYSIWSSTNAGATWTKSAGNLEQTSSGSGNGPSVRWVEILPFANGPAYLAGTSTGLYATDLLQGTATVWTQLSSNELGTSIVDMIKHRRSDGYTAIATHGYGIWSATLTASPVVSNSPSDNFSQPSIRIFPNPLQANSILQVSVSESEFVNMELFDVNGRLVRSIGKMELAAGKHEFELSSEGLGAGIYFCRVQGNDWKKLVKCVLTR